MARFMRTSLGTWTNLDHVRRITTETDRHGNKVARFWGENGESLASEFTGNFELDEELTSDLVPAAAGETAIVVSVYPPEAAPISGRPAEVETRVVPIVAWRIPRPRDEKAGDAPSPVLLDPADCQNEHALVRMCSGKLKAARFEGAVYDSLEDAQSGLLKEAQAEWDAAQEKAG